LTVVEMPVAVRAWAVRDPKKSRSRGNSKSGATSREQFGGDLGPSRWTLVLDTETTTDPGQAIRVGAYQLRRGQRLAQAGLFYDPCGVTPDELRTITNYAASRGLTLLRRAEFNEDVFLRTAWNRRGLVAGHNFPFDAARLSIGHDPPQSGGATMRGGFSFKLSENNKLSRIQVKRANSGAAFIKLTIPSGVQPENRNRERGGKQPNHHGYFLDTATLGGAMFGGRPALKRLAQLLSTEHQKHDADHGEEITPEYLDYLSNDVQVTWECAVELQRRYAAYELPKRPWEIYSEASIGKAHLEKMGLRPFRELNDWPREVIATVMETYYGGRAGCEIRKVPVPGVYVDFTSQYPTVFALQRLHRFFTAKRVSYHREDPARVQKLLNALAVRQLFDKQLWAEELTALVLIAPDRDRLPTRARYNVPRRQRQSRRRPSTYNVAVPYRYGGPPQWYTLSDALGSTLMTGKAPRVIAVLRFAAHGAQDGLTPIDIAGNPAYRVDPSADDFIRRLVELRSDVRTEQQAAEAAGEVLLAIGLDGTQQAMKATANGTAYGSPIELNPNEHRKGAWVTVHLPDGSSYQLHRGRTEEPGRWFHPLIATLVAGAGRLLLATAMRLVSDLGGSWAFCDTDSVFIVATERGKLIPCAGGEHAMPNGEAAIKALSWEQTHAIVQRFEAVDPYQGPGHPKSILKIERENNDPVSGKQREIECVAIASKRYGLFTRRADGTPAILTSGDKRKRSEHGLGHLLPPHAPSPETDDRRWLDEWWEHLLHLELGFADHPEPDWFDEPAIGRVTVSSQHDLKAFADYNENRTYAEQVKPWGFLCIAHPTEQERARREGPRTLITAFERNPIKRLRADWIDRDHPTAAARGIHTSTTRFYRPGSTCVLSYGNYFNQYRQHPESKALDPTDGKRCHTWTRGQLQPWHITATEHIRVGKESKRLSDTHQPAEDEEEQIIEYPPPSRQCRGCDSIVSGKRQWCSEACRRRTRRARSKLASQSAAHRL
jgi:hypothetical protein